MAKRAFQLFFFFILHMIGIIGRLLLRIVAFLIFIFVPFQSDTYLRVYLNILQNVEHSSPVGTLWRRLLHLIVLVMHLKSLHFLYLLLFPSQSDFDMFLHFDIIAYLVPNVGINFICFLFANIPAFFNKQMFFYVQKQLMNCLVTVITLHSPEWFLNSTYKGKLICSFLSQFYATIFNIQSTYQLFIHILLALLESSLLCTVWPQLTALSFFAHFLSFFGHLILVFNFCFITQLAFSTLFTVLAMFHIKMSQIYGEFRLHFKQRHQFQSKLAQLQETFLSTFLFFLQINAMYRWIFASFLLVCVPLNVILTICLLLKRIPPENIIFSHCILYYTFLFIFIFHLAFAYPSKAIHRFGPLFQHTLVCKHPTSVKTRSRIRLSHLIFAFHVPAQDRYGQPIRYGFNYGNWGLVSLENYLKYLVIYSKLAMTLHKLLNT